MASDSPGTDLALILAMANVLVTAGTDDKDYVENYSVGFEDWAARRGVHARMGRRGSPASTPRPSSALPRRCGSARLAPPSSRGWRASAGCSYQNSGEDGARHLPVQHAFGLLGRRGRRGFPVERLCRQADRARFAAPAAPKDKILGQAEYPLSAGSMGVSTTRSRRFPRGKVKGVFFYQSNCVGGYSNPAKLAEFVKAAELSVCIDVQMTETCLACQYVLPDTTYLERLEVPEFVGGRIPYVGLRDQVLEKIHPETRRLIRSSPSWPRHAGRRVFQVHGRRARRCAAADDRAFPDGLREMGGFTTFPDKPQKFGLKTSWNTALQEGSVHQRGVREGRLACVPGLARASGHAG